jgi:hypothetical protein
MTLAAWLLFSFLGICTLGSGAALVSKRMKHYLAGQVIASSNTMADADGEGG